MYAYSWVLFSEELSLGGNPRFISVLSGDNFFKISKTDKKNSFEENWTESTLIHKTFDVMCIL